ncbi:citramalyl-CoA lyase, mitochondrial-like [Ornithodoros turicata]|uniref:citramalyl-CoA lyase, mitochondrial-like n=1 Tax=Ornithodoros turicata TaxID=34597 RepID=UPI003139EDA7
MQPWRSFTKSINRIANISLRNKSTGGNVSERYIPRRALLYVPGNDERKIAKVQKIDVDCVVLDCEDGVAINQKDAARETIRKVLGNTEFTRRTDVAVRINSVDSGLAEDDLKCVLSAQKLPQTLLLPKVEDKNHVSWLVERLGDTKFQIILYVESALGLVNLRDILEHGTKICRLAGLVFGSDDFTASIGATRTKDAKEVLMARQQVVLLAKAYKLQAIDMVHINFKDEEGLRVQALEGAQMGFTGKQVIHPAQVPIVQQAFTPSAEQLDWASRLLAHFDVHQREGKGAFTFEGAMIDMPTVLQARNLVQAYRAVQEE